MYRSAFGRGQPVFAAQDQADARARRQIATWLLCCCALVFAMVVVGGITRLTHSGLSIVEWQPLVGTLPPLTEVQWLEVFQKYQLTPEYQKVNLGMSLAEFKSIFWWEYFHRLLGRLIGLAYFAPLVYFALRRRIPQGWLMKLLGIFVLGGLQGALGWYMVKSGLVDEPRVSQYRLTAHLGLAILIYAAMFWVALGLLFPRPAAAHDTPEVERVRRFAGVLASLIFVMILSGGLVAGIRAGFAYNTFPTMNGNWIPPELFLLDPWYLNFFNNMATVQFDHRLLGWALAVLVPWFWWRSQCLPLSGRARLATHLLLAALVLQVGLGITTLLLVVPVALAAAHQAGAVLLLSAALWCLHALR
ncbi:MAG: COX15/CtaA family protein [Betaproteobacteria bacterium]|nr:COX15/CtaA family protein [Betaproteobacteria bacterium]